MKRDLQHWIAVGVVISALSLAVVIMMLAVQSFQYQQQTERALLRNELAQKKLAVSMQKLCSTYYQWQQRYNEKPILSLEEHCQRAADALRGSTDP